MFTCTIVFSLALLLKLLTSAIIGLANGDPHMKVGHKDCLEGNSKFDNLEHSHK